MNQTLLEALLLVAGITVVAAGCALGIVRLHRYRAQLAQERRDWDAAHRLVLEVCARPDAPMREFEQTPDYAAALRVIDGSATRNREKTRRHMQSYSASPATIAKLLKEREGE